MCADQDYLTANNGEIISHSGYNVGHNYGKNQDCVWKVEAPEGLLVQLDAISFDLESDSVYVYVYWFTIDSLSCKSFNKQKKCLYT